MPETAFNYGRRHPPKIQFPDPGDIRFDIPWTTLGEYLRHLEERGVSPNVASFVGATTLRIHEIGYEDRPPTAEEMDRMKGLARTAMEEGALGIGSSLIYAPAFYAETAGLIELCRVAAEYGGMYITHMRSEGNRLLEAIADVVVFNPAAIQDHATFEFPHQYATGVEHVFVNGQQVVRDGEHTGATPGRFVRGPGTKKK